jgi:type I restriction enzyme R subunit
MQSPATKWRQRAKKLAFAKDMRSAPTASEAKAWSLLRQKQILGLKFRRQRLLYGFIVDFYCPQYALALEIDGSIHDTPEKQLADIQRSLILESHGLHIIRIPNDLVTLAYLTQTISQTISQQTPIFS